MSLSIRHAIEVTPSPSTPVRPAIGVQPIVNQPQERGRIPFHDVSKPRILLAKRPYVSDICIEPLIGYRCEICARAIAIESVSANACPGCIVIFASGWSGRLDDIEQTGKVSPQPRPC